MFCGDCLWVSESDIVRRISVNIDSSPAVDMLGPFWSDKVSKQEVSSHASLVTNDDKYLTSSDAHRFRNICGIATRADGNMVVADSFGIYIAVLHLKNNVQVSTPQVTKVLPFNSNHDSHYDQVLFSTDANTAYWFQLSPGLTMIQGDLQCRETSVTMIQNLYLSRTQFTCIAWDTYSNIPNSVMYILYPKGSTLGCIARLDLPFTKRQIVNLYSYDCDKYINLPSTVLDMIYEYLVVTTNLEFVGLIDIDKECDMKSLIVLPCNKVLIATIPNVSSWSNSSWLWLFDLKTKTCRAMNDFMHVHVINPTHMSLDDTLHKLYVSDASTGSILRIALDRSLFVRKFR